MKKCINILLLSSLLIDVAVADPQLSSVHHDHPNDFYIKIYDDQYVPIQRAQLSSEQLKTLTMTIDTSWSSPKQNPHGYSPNCAIDMDAPNLQLACSWKVGRHGSTDALDSFKEYLQPNFSSVVTAFNDGDLTASIPEKKMNFGWAGAIKFNLYEPNSGTSSAAEPATKTYQINYVLGQSGTGGLFKIIEDVYKATDKVMECATEDMEGEENPVCWSKVAKDFNKLDQQIKSSFHNVWTLGTQASKSGNPYQDVNDMFKVASKIVKTNLIGDGLGSYALVGYLQDDKGYAYQDLQYSIRQSAKDSDHQMDLILSKAILQRLATPDNAKYGVH